MPFVDGATWLAGYLLISCAAIFGCLRDKVEIGIDLPGVITSTHSRDWLPKVEPELCDIIYVPILQCSNQSKFTILALHHGKVWLQIWDLKMCDRVTLQGHESFKFFNFFSHVDFAVLSFQVLFFLILSWNGFDFGKLKSYWWGGFEGLIHTVFVDAM